MVGKTKIGLGISLGVLIVSVILNVWLYVDLQRLGMRVEDLIESKENWKNNAMECYNETEELKQPDFHTVDLEWLVYEEPEGQFRIEVEGTVFNAGEYGATYVVAYATFLTGSSSILGGVTPENFTISSYIPDGVFQGKTHRDFSQTFYESGLLEIFDLVNITIRYEYSTTF